MDRLTYERLTKACNDPWDYCGLDKVCKRDCFKPEPCKMPKMIHRLAEYEDTGLTPDEVAELAEAKHHGRCVVLPCKVGAKAYIVANDCKKNPDHTRFCFCFGKSCGDCESHYRRVWEVEHETFSVGRIIGNMMLDGENTGFGKTVFLTRAEAEKALEVQNER